MRDDTGSKFNSDLDQGEYIAKFFKNLYRAPPDEDLVTLLLRISWVKLSAPLIW